MASWNPNRLLVGALMLAGCGALDEPPTDDLGYVGPAGDLASRLPENLPNQFVAKLYTEGLGRAPDQASWPGIEDFYVRSGCSPATLAAVAHTVYESPEYDALGYTDAQKLLTLYRGVLNRNPEPAALEFWLPLLADGMAWSELIDVFIASAEFADLVPAICTGAPYSFRETPVVPLPGLYTVVDPATVQAQLDAAGAAGGGVVSLEPNTLVFVTAPLVVRENVTLETAGRPGPTAYGRMARLVRVSDFDFGVVHVVSGGALRNVWVDGQRYALGQPGQGRSSINVIALGGDGTVVASNKLTDSMGFDALFSLGIADGYPCTGAGVTFSGNLVTAYSSLHGPDNFSDGIDTVCENTTIVGNEVVDATDAGILLFRSPGATQRSQVYSNTVFQSGNSAYWGLVTDPLRLCQTPGCSPDQEVRSHDFTGASFHDNVVWTSSSAHVDVVLGVGTKIAFGDESAMQIGGTFVDNSTGSQWARSYIAIAVSGALDVTVGNVMTIELVDTFRDNGQAIEYCPMSYVLAAVSSGWASGAIQPHIDQPNMNLCFAVHAR
jgi:hypothetical protein